MFDRFRLMNLLYQLIVYDEGKVEAPPPTDDLDKHAREVLETIKSISIRLNYSRGGNIHETMIQLAKLYTSGLIIFARDKGGDFIPKAAPYMDEQVLLEFNEKLLR